MLMFNEIAHCIISCIVGCLLMLNIMSFYSNNTVNTYALMHLLLHLFIKNNFLLKKLIVKAKYSQPFLLSFKPFPYQLPSRRSICCSLCNPKLL